jgi:hypothetical protein
MRSGVVITYTMTRGPGGEQESQTVGRGSAEAEKKLYDIFDAGRRPNKSHDMWWV